MQVFARMSRKSRYIQIPRKRLRTLSEPPKASAAAFGETSQYATMFTFRRHTSYSDVSVFSILFCENAQYSMESALLECFEGFIFSRFCESVFGSKMSNFGKPDVRQAFGGAKCLPSRFRPPPKASAAAFGKNYVSLEIIAPLDINFGRFKLDCLK